MPENHQELDKQELFCYYCAVLGNPREAAERAGYSGAGAVAGLLRKARIRREIARRVEAEKTRGIEELALQGLKRLAFGEIGGALCLLDPGQIPPGGRPDLFNVAEIRQVKGGGCDIRFYDRIRALELLLTYGRGQDGAGANSLLEALEKGAKAAFAPKEPDHEV